MDRAERVGALEGDRVVPGEIQPEAVTVVVPTLNSGPWIEGFVDVLIALLPGSPIVLVDDCSGEETLRVLRRLAAQREVLTVIENPEQVGQVQATLAGCRIATTEWIVTVDDDWRLTSEILGKLRDLGEHHDAVYGHARRHSSLGNIGLSRVARQLGPLFGVPRSVCEASSTRLFRRELLDPAADSPIDMQLFFTAQRVASCDLDLEMIDGAQRRTSLGSRLGMAASYFKNRIPRRAPWR